MNSRADFQPKPVSQAVGMIAALLAATAAQAGPGFGDAFDLNNNPFAIQSYFASSPAGARQWDPATGAPAGYDPANAAAYKAAVEALYPAGYPGTGKALRKFVDPLPLPGGHPLAALYPANAPQLSALDASGHAVAKYIPVAAPVKWINPQGVQTHDDYYEIAVIEYSDQFHSDLKKATTLRGYVQLDQFATYGLTAPAGWVSKAVPLTYPDGSAVLVHAVDARGKLVPGVKVPAKAVDNPHYLGPVLTASRNTPTRIKFINLLPVGRAELVPGARKEFKTRQNAGAYDSYIDTHPALHAAWQAGAVDSWVELPINEVGKRNGDLFLPVDPSIVGAGLGPDGLHEYTQNRALIHLHGGDNPWISDGTPHQWITPAGEVDPANPLSVAADPTMDPAMIGEFTRGVGAINVPDMFDPGPGAMTYYYPNGQTARMEWYHDHTVGLTRLNVYAGMASTYMLTDPVEQNLITSGVLPGPEATIPLVLQDKTFVPDDIALQDGRWSTTAWGAPGDMWFPHVYETVQDPNQATNFNAVGRWHWGPWFWPSFPSMYALPMGTYQDVTTTPEAWQDTSIVNGVAYPTLTVDPKPYRLRILNASNDRTYTFNMFVADPTVTTADGRSNTEVAMVPVGSRPVCADPLRSDASGCFPANWANDPYGHPGGVPDPKFQGPTLMQIASEGGWLPGVATKDPAPISYLLDKGRAAVLNVDYGTSGLHISNAERADVIVDFTAYAGKTLIVYNDSGAPVPAADPRNEYFTGYGDQSATGGSEDTRAGYGPNSRTLMRFVVAPTVAGAAATTGNLATIDGAIKTAYSTSQESPVVAQAAYNGALGTSWTDTKAFARIWTGSLKEPAFNYVPGDLTPAVFNSVMLSHKGSGYITAPTVMLSAPQTVGGSNAKATATLKIDKIHVINGGAGYRIAPTLTITSLGKGSGANATSRLKVSHVHVTAGGSGYGNGSVQTLTVTSGGRPSRGVTAIALGNATTNRYPGTQVPGVTISAPSVAGGVQATATAVMTGTGTTRRVASVNITNAGSGYAIAPVVSIAAATGTGTKVNATTGTVTTGFKAPTVSFTAAPAGGTTAAGTTVMDATTGTLTGVTITNKGNGYTTAPAVTFSNGTYLVTGLPSASSTVSIQPTVTFAKPLGKDGAGLAGRTATGRAVIDATGRITGVTITDGGSGYTAMPVVTFSAGSTSAAGMAYGSVGEVVLDIPDPLNPGTAGGGGYDNLLTTAAANGGAVGRSPAGLVISFTTPPAAVPAAAGFTASAATAGASGKVFDITLNNAGSGYTATPTVSVSAPVSNSILAAAAPAASFVAATALTDTANGTRQGSALVKTKAIQELFDPTYGRLNATFGVEIPFTSALTQTTIPLGYVDQVTEEFQNGETQIWKITQNGVDAHPIHFHLLNVQLINRVGWDNFITPPEPNELGWKETIKMSPLEDVIVAVRAKKPLLRQSSAGGSFRTGAGFGLPNSVRRQDPSQPEGAQFGFTQIDPSTGMPAAMANTLADYGWEYTWHCHILGHEENDFMRPWKFNANEAAPDAATGLALDRANATLTWIDNADTEFSYTVETDITGSGNFVAAQTQTLPANTTQATVATPSAGAIYRYRVTATGQAGAVASAVLTVADATPPAAPSGLAATDPTSSSIKLNWTDNSANETAFGVIDVATGTTLATVSRSGAEVAGTNIPVSVTVTGLSAGTAYGFQVVAVNAGGTSSSSGIVNTSTTVAAPNPVTGLKATATRVGTTANNTVVLNWTAPTGGGAVTGYTIQRCTVTVGATSCSNFSTLAALTAPAFTYTDNTASRGVGATTRSYTYRVQAANAGGMGNATVTVQTQ